MARKSIDIDDEKMDIIVKAKEKIMDTQKMLVVAIKEYSVNSRQVDAFCTDIEHYKRILSALEDVKL